VRARQAARQQIVDHRVLAHDYLVQPGPDPLNLADEPLRLILRLACVGCDLRHARVPCVRLWSGNPRLV
jgi:hypothetical protein